MKLKRIAIITASAAALATGAGVAVAATADEDAQQREQAVLSDAAERLDTTPAELRQALGAALDGQLAQAVEDGDLTQEQADEIAARREASGTVLGFPGGHGGPGGPGHHGPDGGRGPGVFEDLAAALGISQEQLHERLEAGRTVEQIAEAEGTTLAEVQDEVRAAAEQRLDEAVEAGDLTQARADGIREHLEEHVERLGELDAGGPGGFGGGPRGFGGPPPFGG